MATKKQELVRIEDLSAESALALLSGIKQQDLSDVDLLWREEAESDADAYEFRPARMTVAPGGSKSFALKDGTMIQPPLTGYPIFAVRMRGYWPAKLGAGDSKVPFCSSTGAVRGHVNAEFTQADLAMAQTAKPDMAHPALRDLDAGRGLRPYYECNSCPLSMFGSAHQDGASARGQACKITVLLLMLPKDWHTPVIIKIPTMSVEPWNDYNSTMRQLFGLPFYSHELAIDMERKENRSGQPFTALKFNRGPRIDDADVVRAVIRLQREFKSLIAERDLAVEFYDDEDEYTGNEDYSVDGEVVEAEAAV